jgi:hypothetical protein
MTHGSGLETSRRLALLIPSVVLVVSLTGCGSAHTRSSAVRGSPAQEPTSTTTRAGPATDGPGSGGQGVQGGTASPAAGGAGATRAFCRTLEAKFSGSVKLMSTLSAASSPDEKRKVATKLVADNQAVQAVAPADVKPAVDTLAKSTADLADALAGGGPPRPEAMMGFMSPDSVMAVQQLTDYARSTCGIAQPNLL